MEQSRKGLLQQPSSSTAKCLFHSACFSHFYWSQRQGACKKEPGENYTEQTNLFLNPCFLIFRLPESGLASYLRGDASSRQICCQIPHVWKLTHVFWSQATPGKGIKGGEFIKENSTGRSRQGINIRALENAKPLSINFGWDHNHFKLSYESIAMVSMKTVLCHDYTGKIFIQPKISACGGWAVAERGVRQVCRSPQRVVATSSCCLGLGEGQNKQAGTLVGQATKCSLIQLQL